MVDRLQFANEQDAWQWMYFSIRYPLPATERFAYEDDDHAVVVYYEKSKLPARGTFDAEITINGRNAMIGCNYDR